jgi:predicted choloylglycine hydrolase
VTRHRGAERPPGDPASWPDWQHRVEGVDWSDWRSWLQRLAATDWAATDWAATDWAATDWAAGPRMGAPSKRAPQPHEVIPLALHAFGEDEPGERMAGQLNAVWPAFRRWWQEGANIRPDTDVARARIEQHMPELVPTWHRLTAMLGDDPAAGAALALWNPPPFLTGCSQAAVLSGGPALIRNYDWDYRLFDATVARTAYGGRRVLGMLDCLWGLLDGVNDAGLALSLTFGGRPQVGEGFGIPLVIRYVLQVCGTVADAVRTLRRIPVHMSYNVTALDRDGRRATVYLAPDRPARVTGRAVATNHQGTVEWAPYAAAIRTVERQERLEELLTGGADVPAVVAACLRPPLYATRFGAGFGTLYTAEYRPADGVARYHWPGQTWTHALDQLGPGDVQVQLSPA